MQKMYDEFIEFLAKNAALFISLLIGVVAKLAIDNKEKQLTKKEIAVKVILSLFIGYVTGSYLEAKGMDGYIKIVVPVATLLGESLVVWVMQNFNKILNIFLEMLKGKQK